MSENDPGGRGDVGYSGDNPDDEERESFPWLWMFIPLPHHLPVPHGWQMAEPSAPMDLLRSPLPSTGLDSSLVVLQVPRSNSPLLDEMHDIAAGALAGRAQDASDQVRSFGPQRTPGSLTAQELRELTADDPADRPMLTLVEVAFPNRDDADLDILLDRAVERARWLQQAVATLTQGAVRLVSRRHLPPFIFVLTGHVHTGGKKPTFDEARLLHVSGGAPPSSYSIPAKALDAGKLEHLGQAMGDVVIGRAFIDYADLRREAFVQHQLDGNERLCITTLATAGEVLASTMITQLMWEERLDPYEVAATFDPTRAHTAQLDTYLQPRLGGDWHRTGDRVVARYFRDLVHLRHRVVHAGYRPDDIAVTEAIAALLDFEHFLVDRLCHPKTLNKYARTAISFTGTDGLKKRGRWSRKIEQFATDPTQPDWDMSFVRWRAHLERALDSQSTHPGSEPLRIDAYTETTDGSTRCLLHDPTALAAALVDPADYLNSVMLEQVAEIETSGPPGEMIRVGFRLDEHALVPTSGWVPEYELFPEMTILPGDNIT